MASFRKKINALKRIGNSFFTHSCASCGKAVRGNCICEECRAKIIPAEKAQKDSAFAYCYDGPARDVLIRYKFNGDYLYCLDTLCDWLLEGFAKLPEEEIDFVVPVPSYKRKTTRLTELAENFAVLAELPYKPKLLKKIRSTRKQHDLPREERLTNLIGAFEADASAEGKTILLVDDIYTTGSTAAECSKALYAKGAKKVIVLTVLKAGKIEGE